MGWARSHIYASALALASLLVITGALFVISRSARTNPVGTSAWSGNAGVLGPTSATGLPITGGQKSPTVEVRYATGTLPYENAAPVSDSKGTMQTGANTSSYDFNALLAELSLPPKASGTTSTDTPSASDTLNAWDYIPMSIISIKSPTSGRTKAQQALYDYGNEVGSYIQGYDAAHSNQSQVLDDADKDRQNVTKQTAVEKIGTDLQFIGQSIAEITDVPDAAQADTTALSNAYIDIGKKLVLVAQAEPKTDGVLVAAIKNYDAGVNTFNQRYIALANLFSSYGVTFSTSDPGSVFTFSPSGL
ncbi:MAG TPA: hypothetical protein VMU13_02230 [Candidatus Paceibacterota bacterium]|nr:hypothetical protein [Candidatus Paceibacterota bacterium]